MNPFYARDASKMKLLFAVYQSSKYCVYGIHCWDSTYTNGSEDVGERSMDINGDLQIINNLARESV